MTPQEKAKELVGKYRNLTKIKIAPGVGVMTKTDLAKEYATIAVDEMITQLDEMCKPEYVSFWHGEKAGETQDGYFIKEYWEEVKTEIENL